MTHFLFSPVLDAPASPFFALSFSSPAADPTLFPAISVCREYEQDDKHPRQNINTPKAALLVTPLCKEWAARP